MLTEISVRSTSTWVPMGFNPHTHLQVCFGSCACSVDTRCDGDTECKGEKEGEK